MNTAHIKIQKFRKIAFMLVIALACVLIFTGIASAQDSTTTLPQEFVANFAKLLSFVLQALSKIFLPIIMLTGALMKSDFIFSGTMNETLLSIWTQVRNLVNVIFAIMLIVVALYNVLGLGESAEGGAYLQFKKALPKVVLGLVLVNFSYLGVRVLIDVVNVGTTIAFSIPNSTGLPARVQQELKANNSLNAFCTLAEKAATLDKTIKDENAKKIPPPKKGAKPKVTEPAAPPTVEICENGVLKEKILDKLTEWGIDGAVPIMAIKFMNLQELDKVSEGIQKSGGDIAKLSLNLIVSIIMYLLYGVSFLALFILLLGRAVALWMVIVFSPVIAIQLAFPQLISAVGGGDYSQKIIKTLIAPIIIGFVMSIGFMILGTMQNVDYSNTHLDALSISTSATDLQTSNIETFQQFMIAIGAVAFVFMGVKSAASDAIGGEIAGTVLDVAKRTGEWVATAPFKYAPIFPVQAPDGSHFNASPAAMLKMIDNIPGAMESAAAKEAQLIFPTDGLEAKLKEVRKAEDLPVFQDIIKSSNTEELVRSKELRQAAKNIDKNINQIPAELRPYVKILANDESKESDIRDAIEKIRKLSGGSESALDPTKRQEIATTATASIVQVKREPQKVLKELKAAKEKLETGNVSESEQKTLLVKIVDDAHLTPPEKAAIATALKGDSDPTIKAVGTGLESAPASNPPAAAPTVNAPVTAPAGAQPAASAAAPVAPASPPTQPAAQPANSPAANPPAAPPPATP